MNTDQLKNQSFFDLGNLDSIRKEALKGAGDQGASDQALKKAAQQFESIFTQMLLQSMRKANEALEDKDSPFNSSGVKFFEEMHDQQLSMHLSEKGSLGLADLIVQQLSPNSEKYKPASVLRADADIATNQPAPTTIKQSDALSTQSSDEQTGFGSPKEFVESVWNYAQSAAKKLGLNPAVMVAQAALETGWGKHIISKHDGSSSFNLFNIKADGRWDGESAKKSTLEFEGGLPVKKQAHFRAYHSLEQSFNDYVSFLQENPRYKQALAKADDSHAYLDELQSAGYATDPNYANKIKSVLKRIDISDLVSGALTKGVR
ncbi:flagellar assembly peptidoglycan hydrolase FlgJ [Pseudoalteromonas sp. J010]|uniref:flagellar assembly peptidoglycan hydrolase FlgJ n=1 Tax=Pseudoalteromonas sp. J010 TaxID=998465 RepID=UPI000F64A450|nr:flagellar assembly peptidoglycan hydrolase FlgJ [Pseudoalteromonas sp. J010]RRS09052.1 flagellar assembly peptidoglycan hydrolase FlgJ [Pseudoalteromonas sp. J010]